MSKALLATERDLAQGKLRFLFNALGAIVGNSRWKQILLELSDSGSHCTVYTNARGGHSNTCRRTVRDRGQDAVKRSTRVWNAGQRVNDEFPGRSNGQDDFTHYRIGQRSTPLSRRYRLLLLVFISFSAATDYYTVTITLRT